MPETSRTIALADRIDRLNAAIGRTVAWACLLVVLVQFAVVVMRYVFGAGSIWLTETIIYGHATVLMLAAAWTLREGGHVRVDIFYAKLSRRGKAWVDLFGVIFLLMPWLALLAWTAWTYVSYSWQTSEISVQSNGMPAMYVLKSTLLGFVILVGLQGLAWMGRSILVLGGREPPPVETLTGPLG